MPVALLADAEALQRLLAPAHGGARAERDGLGHDAFEVALAAGNARVERHRHPAELEAAARQRDERALELRARFGIGRRRPQVHEARVAFFASEPREEA